MASLFEDRGKTGTTWRLQVMVDGQRRTVRLGKLPKRQAESVLRHVEALASARIDGSAPPEATSHWLAAASETLREKLVKAELAAPVEKLQVLTIGRLIDDYREKRFAILKRSSQLVNEQAFGSMKLILGADTPVGEVSPADAEDFRVTLIAGGYAEATVRKRCSVASKLYRYAARRRLIDRNPFDDGEVPRANVATKRRAFISGPDAVKVLKQLPTLQWQLLFALARWGGLRVGSEPRQLQWSHIDWAGQRFRVVAPKTGDRWPPIFPELASLLRDAFEQAEEGETHVLPMLRTRSDPSLRKTLIAAIERAGLTVWPRLWHNLRATRQTELAADYPTHVVCAWMGNSEKIAAKHYLQVTDDDYCRAAAQIPAHAGSRKGPHQSSGENRQSPETPVFPALRTDEDDTSVCSIAETGLEPVQEFPPGGF